MDKERAEEVPHLEWITINIRQSPHLYPSLPFLNSPVA
ncbi:hypothetical protein GGP44_000142 [Salinibacter ruber]|nr:hypothetical protein [Salinibacter ruber]